MNIGGINNLKSYSINAGGTVGYRLFSREAESRLLLLKPDLSQAIVHVLDDLGQSIYAGGFGDGFHEGIVSLMSAEYPESIIVSTVRISGGEAGMNSAGSRKKLEAGKMLENAAESPPPNAQCVWQRFSSFLYE